MKHKIKIKYYVRYADDFVVVSQDKDYLLELIPKIADFLDENLKLTLHPNKIILKTFASGVDFLGWIHFSNHRVLRTSTKRRAVKALHGSDNINKLSSYKGLLSHGNQYHLQTEFLRKITEIEKRGEVKP